MAADFGTGVATNVTNAIIVAVVQKLTDVIELEGNLQILDTDFSTMEGYLNNIRNQFQDQQKKLPGPVERCLEKMNNALGEAKDLMDRAKRHGERVWCLRCCCFLCDANLPTQIRAWKARFHSIFKELEMDLSISANTQQILSSAAHQADLLLQPVPNSGFIGSGIRSAQDQLQTWLTEPQCQSPVIGVYGMAGVGKTSLLKVIYNTYKKEVSGTFDVVIWFTVSQNFQIKELQASIAKELNLNLEETSSIEERKMRLYAALQKKKFLLILDDVWNPIDLIDEVGVRFGDDNRSKIVISSRSRDVIGRMGAIEYSMSIHPLTAEEGWELFRRGAFTNGAVSESNIDESIAREIASECKGLPLALNAVAAAMRWKMTNDQWSRALVMMKTADPSFPTTHKTIDADLYQKLRWSYNDLSDPNLKICFLYFAAFPEDAGIPVEDLVAMWSGEGLATPRGTTYLMDIGREYIDLLVNRCLVDYIDEIGLKRRSLHVHDVLRDMAIHIGQKEEHWLLAAGQRLQNFPNAEEIRDCKRISLLGNDIHDLPMDFRCPRLVSLVLARNENLTKVPEGFLSNLMSLRVLDLSGTSISSMPASMGQLGQLEFLNLKRCTSLKDLPESICNLYRLQFLNLGWCYELHSLPTRIGQLRNLKHLSLNFCKSLMTIPHEIFQLTSLNKLCLPMHSSFTVNAEDLTSLSNLMELQVAIRPHIKVGTVGSWSEMRHLRFTYNYDADRNRDEVEEDILRESIKHMKKLESLSLANYQEVNLPNSICQFQNMRSLCLTACCELRELPGLEIGNESTHGGFPMLENMELRGLDKLESITGSSSVGNERTMPKLEMLHIENCPLVKKLLLTVDKLPNLTEIMIGLCYEVMELDFTDGGFPMLKHLSLYSLNKLQSITGSFTKLQSLRINECPLLRKLPLGMENLPTLKSIRGELEWWENINWEDENTKNNFSQIFRANNR